MTAKIKTAKVYRWKDTEGVKRTNFPHHHITPLTIIFSVQNKIYLKSQDITDQEAIDIIHYTMARNHQPSEIRIITLKNSKPYRWTTSATLYS